MMNTDKVLYRLSESQKSIWYLEKAYPGTSLNIVAGTLRLKGEIDYPALEKALNIFVKKSDSMRLRIIEADGEAAQYVTEYRAFDVDYFDFSKGGGLNDLFAWDEGVTRTPFNIVENQLFYCAVFKVSEDEGGFYMKMHHLISDAWTMGLMTRQVIDFYSKIKSGQPVDESPNPSYIDHLHSNEEYERSDRFEKDKAYWNNKFETLPEMTVLKPQKAGDYSVSARRKTLVTPVKLSNKIREFCSANNLSVFTLFMAALSIYINRVTGNEDIILGTTILNRTGLKEKETSGMFVSVAAPVRISVDDTMDFKTFSKCMLRENTDVLRHQKYPYNYLIRDLKKKYKHTGRLFDIVLSYQNSKFQKNETEEDYVGKWLFSGCQVESLIISINDREDGGNLIIDYDFLTDVFNIKEIEFIHQHIISLLWHALDNPVKSISKLEMISEREKHRILHEFNNTYADFPMDKTIQQMFEEQAEKTPDNIALIFNDSKMTYAELNERSNKLARTLRDKGVGSDKIVGIMTYRSLEMMVGILGILKAGGAYMPIDPDYPSERKSYMLKNSCTGILLTRHDLVSSVDFSGLILDLDDQSNYSDETSNPPKTNGPKDLAYVIYTSGSTGRPKGVMVEHTGVINRINWMQKNYPLIENSKIMQKTTYSFDVSVWELFWWSFVGAAACFINSGDEKDPEAIIRTIEKNNITTIHFVPSMLTAFLIYVEAKNSIARLASLKNVFASGEALTVQQVRHFNKLLYETNGTRLSNLYGPTEATVDVSGFECSPMPPLGSVPIGKPIDNINLYIFDKNQNLLPVGIPGELYIGGAGVARGYLYNPELTGEKFVINPYKRNEILYRTGDRARWYPKGDIEFLGRIDHQVKIRGFRIELGEIEARLTSHPLIREAVVKSFSDDAGMPFLAAYIVADGGIGADEIRGYLTQALPDYMVPASYTFLEKMPLSNNGKTDRNALERPDDISLDADEYTPPANETEASLTEIWRKVLGITRIGVLDNYAALGGDSLNAIKIITEIHKTFGIEISPKEIFALHTIRRLAERMNASGGQKNSYSQIPKVTESSCYPVSSAQKRQYILNRISGGISYNLPGGMALEGRIDADRIKSVFQRIVKRHESLRTRFGLREGEPVQIIENSIEFKIDYAHAPESSDDNLMEAFVKPFDLSAAPLLRVRLVSFSDEKHVLLFDMHHIISDGASINIIIQEFTELYCGGELPELRVQYKDYSAWHSRLLETEKLKKQEAYWLEKFEGEIPALNMPLDFARPSIQSFNGNRLRFTIDEKLTRSIKTLAAKTGTTLFMLLFATYNVLLSKYTGQEDIIVGTPVEGRRHDDLNGIIGMFVNTLAIRSCPAGEKTFEAFLNEVKEDLLSAYDNQEYPFEELVEKVDVKRDASRSPLFDTMFILQNMELTEFSAGGFTAKPYTYNNKTSKFDLSIEAMDKGETIEYSIEYCTDLFAEETIRRLSSHFVNALSEIAESPLKKLGDISILSEAERQQLLYGFNDTDADYPRDKTIHRIFEEQAEKTPDNIALVFKDKKMTYRELNKKANQLAHTLREKGIGPDDIAGIIADRSFEMIIAILGVLKAGGAYMPIDPEYPDERKSYMLKNSGTKVLLTKKRFELPYEGITLYLDDPSVYDEDASNLMPAGKPSDLAYIIYTSGSTGLPKGVMIEHKNVVRLMFNDKFQFDFGASDVWTLFHSCCFDFSVWEMYGALLYGGKLVIISKEAAVDTREFHKILTAEKVTVLNQTPSAFYNLISVDSMINNRISSVRYVIFGGEALKPPMLKAFKEKYPGIKLINMYGITETTVHVTFKEITQADTEKSLSNIGMPIPTLGVYILDKNLKPLPVGVAGEICVGGAGVARGYLNNEQLTQERFIQIPELGAGTIYRSGDLGTRLENGDIVYLGRIDSQVKIRGYRIELGEIESALLKHQAVDEAVITVHETSSGDKKLCAYFRSDTVLSSKELTAFLSGMLPDYMIPTYFIKIDVFPLNRNGKIDKSCLPKPNEAFAAGTGSVLPRNVTEEIMAEAWCEVLDIPSVGIDDNFFDLGGDSLSAIKVLGMLKIGINIVDFYIRPTIRQLSEKLVSEYYKPSLLIKMSKNKTTAKKSVICFPYGGGSALAFKDICNSLMQKNADIDLYSVNLPGHDYGVNDDLEPIEKVAEKLVKEIAENISGDVILYGHCVGSALLLATANLLEKSDIKLKSVFIGGILAPPLLRLYGFFYKPWFFISDNNIIKFLKRIGMPADLLAEKDYVKYIIKAFRHDTGGFISYLYAYTISKKGRLKSTLYFIAGDKDKTTKNYNKRFKSWNKYFDNVELIVLNNANHYFINTHSFEVAEYFVQK